MDRKGVRQVTPKNGSESAVANFVENFSSGYVARAVANWPKQGSKSPWRVYQNYFRDFVSLKWSSLDDGALEFSNPPDVSPDPALASTVLKKSVA
jgi:hypothetical protein